MLFNVLERGENNEKVPVPLSVSGGIPMVLFIKQALLVKEVVLC